MREAGRPVSRRTADDVLALAFTKVRRMKATEIAFASADGASTVAALMWRPDAAADADVRGVVQLVHGMAEHKSRYLLFAEFLVDQGFVVCAHDHVGHGKTASCPEDYGHIPFRPKQSEEALTESNKRLNGADILIQDTHTLRCMMQRRFPNVPYVLFGHSMGSYVVRAYATRHGEGLAAVILCGTGQTPQWLSRVGIAATHLLAATHGEGERYHSGLVDSLGVGAFSRQVPDAKTNYDWISSERDAVDEYASDPSCGFMFTVGGYAALTGATLEAVSPKCAARIPKDLPMLFISGAEDPVGGKGKGVKAAVEEYRAAGVHTVDVHLYEGMRHEIVNRAEGKQVREDVASWLKKQGI